MIVDNVIFSLAHGPYFHIQITQRYVGPILTDTLTNPRADSVRKARRQDPFEFLVVSTFYALNDNTYNEYLHRPNRQITSTTI